MSLRSIEYYNLQFQAYPEAMILCGYGLKLAELRDLLVKILMCKLW